MPNYCEGDLVVWGEDPSLVDFIEQARNGEVALSADKFIPYPDRYRALDEAAKEWEAANPNGSLRDRPKDGFNAGGYEWRLANWGCKWDFGNVRVLKLDPSYRVAYTFSTAWSPAKPVLAKMTFLYPKLRFSYYWYEQGMQQQGSYEASGGRITREYTGYYDGPRGG